MEGKNVIFLLSVFFYGEQGRRSVESTRLPLKWPGFESWRRRRHMWAEFVVVPRGFFQVLPSPQKPTLPNTNSIWNARTGAPSAPWVNKLQFQLQITILRTPIPLQLPGIRLTRLRALDFSASPS